MKCVVVSLVLGVVAFGATAEAADKKKCLDSAPRGQELRDQGKLLEAREQFLVCADPACPPPVPTYCAEWLDDLKKKVPTIIVRVADPSGKDVTDAVVTLDDKPATADGRPNEVDPGNHRLRVTRPGAKDVDQTVVAAAGEKGRIVAVKLEPVNAPVVTTTVAPPSNGGLLAKVPVGSLIGWGVGAVGLIGFGAFGIKANLDYNSYESSCGNRCATSARDDVNGTMTVADVFLVVGLVGAAVGTVIYLVSPPPAERHALGRTAWSF